MKNPIAITKKSYNRILKIDDVIAKLDQLLARQADLEHQVAQLSDRLSDQQAVVTSQLHELKQQVQSIEKINDLRFFSQYQTPDEDSLAARKRFFKHLPQAYGPLRTFQLGSVKLLKALTKLCDAHHLPYFIQGGTLIGAVRHHGFVPWDDDTDIGMLRDDIATLYDVLKGNSEYRLAIVYDFYVKCRQLRFRTTDPDNPCFVDIMIYDYAKDLPPLNEAWDIWHAHKTSISQKLEAADPELTAFWRRKIYVDDTSPEGQKLRALYEKFYDPLIDRNANRTNFTDLIWGLDNLPLDTIHIFPKSGIFPTIPLEFEGLTVAAIKDYDFYFERVYGDIYQLPNDIITHFQHINHTNINTTAIEKFLRA